ncbi:18126_t:CDS:2 [Funneliformis geosporum]|uniref:9063_t:CDS:1 n=1 Tax=Funneliformis geosporum TaxID=1117311 RepID=A0A9W4SG43_9GLOM|nr:9063_t:CDS:2 [Funneliformis geosporum]CAI2190371.1 18126_t:CDS:2 [Funneliformis geosporum]
MIHQHTSDGFPKTHLSTNELNSEDEGKQLNKKDIQIELFESVVIFRGNVNESVGSLLRGEIQLTLNKPEKIISIELQFYGETRTFSLSSFGAATDDKIELISKDISFLNYSKSRSIFCKLFSKLPNKQNYSTFSSGIHKLPFEFQLPGSLPESIKAKLGSIQYKLKCKVNHISKFHSKTLSNFRQVEIIRLPDYVNYSYGIEISRIHEQIVEYQLSIPNNSFPLGDTVPIHIKLIPLIKKFKLHSIQIRLVQNVTYINNGRKNEYIQYLNHSQFDNVKELKEDDYCEENEIGNSIYEKALMFELPKCNNNMIYCSLDTPLIEIKHELEFNIINLPNYEDTSFYCPCHPEYQRIARRVLGDSDDDEEHNNCTCNYTTVENCFHVNNPPRYSYLY